MDYTQNDKRKPLFIIPSFFSLQYAGDIGYFSIGAGRAFYKERIKISAMYGYVPKFKAKTSIHTIALLHSGDIYKIKTFQNSFLKANIGFFYSITITPNSDKTFIKMPSQYPDNYYPPNAIRIGIFSGIKYNIKFDKLKPFKSYDFYINSVTNDLYIQYFLKTFGVGFFNITTLSLGINAYL